MCQLFIIKCNQGNPQLVSQRYIERVCPAYRETGGDIGGSVDKHLIHGHKAHWNE